MYEIGLLIYVAAIIASCYLSWDAFKHRFLPIARPLMGLSILLALVCSVRLLGLIGSQLNQWIMQAIEDFEYFLIHPSIIPLWVWALLEYYQDKKIPFTHKVLLIFLIQPSIVITLALTDIFNNGFLSQISATGLVDPKDRLGGYLQVRHAYGLVTIIGLTLVTPYLVRKRRQSPFSDLFIVTLTIAIPYTLHLLYRENLINISLGAPAFILFVVWGSRQYRLLHVMPVALQGLIDKMDAGILVSNVHSKLLYINDYAQRLFSLNVSTSKLQQHELSTPEVFEQHFDFTLARKQTSLMQTNSQKHDGEVRYINAVLQPIFSPKLKQHLGSTISFHDITERKQAELELQSYNQQKSEFFAGISHEFRTPLTLSLGNIDDVLHDLHTLPPKQLEAPLLQAKANNKRLLSLVNQLLELSCIDKGSLTIKPVKLQLSTYLPMLIANFESLADRHNITLHFNVSHTAQRDSDIYFDSDALDKIMINLLSNALKSITGNTGGEVHIGIDHAEHNQLQITVRDSGCGIAADALPHIFEMFYSHQVNNTAWPQSTGVGLSLVKQLLVLHDADIAVNSTAEGNGSCFSVKLQRGYLHFPEDMIIHHTGSTRETNTAIIDDSPHMQGLINTDNNTQSPTDKNMLISTDSNKQVLLAEDNPDMRRYIRKHLPDFQLTEAADGKAALELAQQLQPDLVLSDVMMPKMNGYDLCKQLKSDAQTSHIPVVLLTAKSAQTEKLEGLSLGADDYLSKPFDVRELNLRINNLIVAKQAIQAFYKANGLEKAINHSKLPKRETAFLEKLQHYVREHIANTEIKVSDLAAVVHMSERSLSRKVKMLTGDTPKKMLLTIRLELAAQLLRKSEDNITNLSCQVGFSDASHFARTFKAHYAMTPSEYRESR
uniref:histidine kinase n=1 Tax=uncultured Thiotrichaceae bacterium TaxID=298394 RepID=A0A6S6SIP8_9GAMM|nr:MAG: Two component transcriptional regulator, AraC family [uncultured Thiotrichaceae bacterium]